MDATSEAWLYSDEMASCVEGYDESLHACRLRIIAHVNALRAAFDADDIMGGTLDFLTVRTIFADE